MSPFERASDALSNQLETLTPRAQSLFFACVADVLLPGYERWSNGAAGGNSQLLRAAIDTGRRFSLTGVRPDDAGALLQAMEQHAPAESQASSPGFTVAQDAWTCADVSLRIPEERFEASNGLWYALEPQFQAVSERLFGLTDVGSARQEEGEQAALNDPVLAEAIINVGLVFRRLDSTSAPTEADETTALRLLVALAPQPAGR